MYLTNYGYFFTWLYFANVLQYYILEKCMSDKAKLKYNEIALEILFEIAICLEVTITILYWIVLYVGPPEGYSFYSTFSVHAIPMILLFFDFLFNRFRFHGWHILIVFTIAIIYAFCINLPYSLEVEPVYSVLDWQTGLSGGLIAGAIAVTLLMFGFGRLVFSCIKRRIYSSQSQKINEGEH